MGLTKPYYRIYRPNLKGGRDLYLLDEKYANDRQHLVRTYHKIEQDLKQIFDSIDPSASNSGTNSQELFRIFLDASTEVENHCKAILKANGYSAKRGKWNIDDYYKVNSASKLSEYNVLLPVWHPSPKELVPFSDWKNGSSLSWYKAYNLVKHDRSGEFNRANLDNVVEAVAAVFVTIFAQFYTLAFKPDQVTTSWNVDDEGYLYHEGGMFKIKVPSWSNSAQYEFDWENTVSKLSDPFENYPF